MQGNDVSFPSGVDMADCSGVSFPVLDKMCIKPIRGCWQPCWVLKIIYKQVMGEKGVSLAFSG